MSATAVYFGDMRNRTGRPGWAWRSAGVSNACGRRSIRPRAARYDDACHAVGLADRVRCGKNPRVMQMDISKITPGSVEAVSIGTANPFLRDDGNPVALAIKLLDTAAEVIQYDPAAAVACIARTTDLLRAGLGASVHHPDWTTGRLRRSGLAPWQMRRVTAHIETAMGSTIRLGDCAKIVRLSKSHFARAFRVSFGETFARHVVAHRTESAQQMMLCTNDPLSQIAVACGFADQAHFTRAFRKRAGQSPAAWRRQRHAGPLSTG
jgi:AraC family transcriptional regulator